MRRAILALLLAILALPVAAQDVTVGSKKFTESVVLGEIAAQVARGAGATVVHRREIGGTRILWEALLRGDIDLYPEYTGTIEQELLLSGEATSPGAMRQALARRGITISGPLGFNNSYAIGVTRRTADRLALKTISDLRRHPALVLGFSNEFLSRADGWPALRARYGLADTKPRGLDHALAYRGLVAGSIHVTDVYATDAEVAYYGLALLADDLGHFPAYEAVLLYRGDLARRAPRVVAALSRLDGTIDAARMAAMNAEAQIDRRPESEIAAAFVGPRFGKTGSVPAEERTARLWRTTLDHLALVAISLLAAIVLAVPLGIFAARRPLAGQAVLAVVGLFQTIPSLALFVFMIPLLGIGGPPAVVALFLYSLLPIVRNTHAGLTGIDPAMIESADALGLEPAARLRIVELPLAIRPIMAGIKTAAVINVGTATLGALIGAGGYGQPILTGIRLDDTGLILEGAVPAALLALAVQGIFDLIERAAVPAGLRRGSAG